MSHDRFFRRILLCIKQRSNNSRGGKGNTVPDRKQTPCAHPRSENFLLSRVGASLKKSNNTYLNMWRYFYRRFFKRSSSDDIGIDLHPIPDRLVADMEFSTDILDQHSGHPRFDDRIPSLFRIRFTHDSPSFFVGTQCIHSKRGESQNSEV